MFKLQCFNEETKEEFTEPYFEMKFLNDLVGEMVFNYNDIGNKVFDLSVTIPGAFFRFDLISNMQFPEGLIFEDTVFFTEAILKGHFQKLV